MAGRRLLRSAVMPTGSMARPAMTHPFAAMMGPSRGRRRTKNLGWYFAALDHLEQREQRVKQEAEEVEATGGAGVYPTTAPFPEPPLHGKERPLAFMTYQFGDDEDADQETVVFELADDVAPESVQNFLALLSWRPAEGEVTIGGLMAPDSEGNPTFKEGFSPATADELLKEWRRTGAGATDAARAALGINITQANKQWAKSRKQGRQAARGGEAVAPSRREAHATLPADADTTRMLATRWQPKGYYGCEIHRVRPTLGFETGDYHLNTGRGSRSARPAEPLLADESFAGRHSVAGTLSYCNSGTDSNGSAVFVSVAPQPHLDGRNVCFGRVVSGMATVQRISQSLAVAHRPVERVVIVDCGRHSRPPAEQDA